MKSEPAKDLAIYNDVRRTICYNYKQSKPAEEDPAVELNK